MALKMDRQVDAVEIGYYLNETASRGVVVSASTAGSGVSLDNPANLATVAAASSGQRPLGILLNDFVNVDQTRQPLNWHKDQSQVGNKATILTKGWVVTNQVAGTPNKGDYAVLASSGSVTGVAPEAGAAAWNRAANPFVGRFRTTKDQNGYARVYVDL